MRVLVCGRHFDAAIDALGQHGFEAIPTDAIHPIHTERAPVDAEILWCGVLCWIKPCVKDSMPSLRYVCCPATGIDHIDVTGLNARGVNVLSLRDCFEDIRDVSATAELTLLLMLAMLRPMGGRQLGNDLKGKRVLIVGGGRIGSQVWNLCYAFGCELMTIDKHNAHTLCEELSQADIVTLHVPLNAETEGMIDATAFALMKPGAILINTSRGKVIDEKALIHFLRLGKLRAALDVHANEPGPPDPALVELAKDSRRLILTNHIGGYTLESRAATDRAMVACLMRHLEADRG